MEYANGDTALAYAVDGQRVDIGGDSQDPHMAYARDALNEARQTAGVLVFTGNGNYGISQGQLLDYAARRAEALNAEGDHRGESTALPPITIGSSWAFFAGRDESPVTGVLVKTDWAQGPPKPGMDVSPFSKLSADATKESTGTGAFPIAA
jgi:hypothetical protein